MEFLGDESMVAPRLHDTALAPDEAKLAYETLMQAISVMWRDMGVAHGDLSPYNILWWHGKPWIIDFPQAVDRRTHPEAHVLLARDIENVSRYFEPYFPADTHALLGSLI